MIFEWFSRAAFVMCFVVLDAIIIQASYIKYEAVWSIFIFARKKKFYLITHWMVHTVYFRIQVTIAKSSCIRFHHFSIFPFPINCSTSEQLMFNKQFQCLPVPFYIFSLIFFFFCRTRSTRISKITEEKKPSSAHY